MTRFALFSVLAVAAAGCGSGHHAATATSASTRPASSSTSDTTTAKAPSAAASTARCPTSALAIWLGLGEGGAAAGSTYYPIELSNVSGHACQVLGFPGVSAWNQHQLGSPAGRNHSAAPKTLVLVPGATVHTVLQITDVSNFPASRCKPVNAIGLKVIPPDERTSQAIPFSFRACSKPGSVFLSVQPLQAGVGIPGYPG